MATMQQRINFIQEIFPAAKKVSDTTGIPLEFILAQAALETGWGQKILPGTKNLFNIKADPSWKGQVKEFKVPEYYNGKLVYEVSKFRVYNSYEESIYDWLNFLQKNPRYSKLFDPEVKGDPYKLAYEIQKAGYATDPNYAQKLIATMDGPTLKIALKNLKNSDSLQDFHTHTIRPVDKPSFYTHTVRPGDTLSKIAKKYNVSLEDLLRANPWIKNPNHIEVGWKIRIPGYGEKIRNSLREGTRRIDPLVIDLDGDGIELTDIKESKAMFDLTGSGFANRVGWVYNFAQRRVWG